MNKEKIKVGRRERHPLTINPHQDLLNSINNLFIAIKVNQSPDCTQRLKDYYPIPTNKELDEMHHKIIDAFRSFEKPMVHY